MGNQRIQYVCDPGEHVFIGHGEWLSVIEGNFLGDKIYDVAIPVFPGLLSASISINPLNQGDERRAEVAEWERDEQTMVLVRDAAVSNYENALREENREILHDFLEGDRRDALQHFDSDAHR